jgi:hypothetical protein
MHYRNERRQTISPYANVINKWNRIEWKIIIFSASHRAENFSFIWYGALLLFHMQHSGCNIEKLNIFLSRGMRIEKFAEDRKYEAFLLINNFFCNLQTFLNFSRLISIFLLHKNEWNENEQKVILEKKKKVRCDMSSAFLQLLLKGFSVLSRSYAT